MKHFQGDGVIVFGIFWIKLVFSAEIHRYPHFFQNSFNRFVIFYPMSGIWRQAASASVRWNVYLSDPLVHRLSRQLLLLLVVWDLCKYSLFVGNKRDNKDVTLLCFIVLKYWFLFVCLLRLAWECLAHMLTSEKY